MGRKRWALALLVVVAPGCLSTAQRDRAFSNDWAHQVRSENEFKARKARIGGDELVLVGKNRGPRAAVEVDDKGRPRLNVGKKTGLSADLDLNEGEPEAKVKYKLKW
jgi:hypothetical protein